jgi:hypothetical protein
MTRESEKSRVGEEWNAGRELTRADFLLEVSVRLECAQSVNSAFYSAARSQSQNETLVDVSCWRKCKHGMAAPGAP